MWGRGIRKILISGEESVGLGVRCWPSSLGLETNRIHFGLFFMPSLCLTLTKLKKSGKIQQENVKINSTETGCQDVN
jgi:hypothetical protein